MMLTRTKITAQKQTGVVLMVSLLLLIVMTILGISGMKTTTLEEKMSGNYRDSNLAYQAAESALREAEQYVGLPGGSVDTAIAGFYRPAGPGIARLWDTVTWTPGTDTVAYGTNGNGTLGNEYKEQPQYIIEELEPLEDCTASADIGVGAGAAGNKVPERCYYRITARGVGGTTTAVVTLQSVYRKPL